MEANRRVARLLAAKLIQKGQRRPEVRRGDRLEPSKPLRHDADDVELRSVQQDRTIEDAGIARKVLRPRAVAEDDGRNSTRLVVCRCQRASAHQRWHQGARKKFPVTSRPSRRTPSSHAWTSPVVANVSEKTSVSRTSASYCGRVKPVEFRIGGYLAIGGVQPVRIADLVDAEDVGVENREDDGHEPEAKSDGHHNRQPDQRRAKERPARVAHVARQPVEERRAARVAAGLLGRLHRAERLDRLQACRVGAQAGTFQPLRFARDMELQFLAQIGLAVGSEEQRAEPALHNVPGAHVRFSAARG